MKSFLKKVKVAIFILSLCTFSFPLFSNEIKIVTLEDAVSLALENNISLKQKEIIQESSHRSYNHVWNNLSPSVSVGAGVSKANKTFSENYTAYIQGKINISLSPALYSSVKTARLNYEAGLISYDAAVKEIELSVQTVFYGLLYQEEAISLQEASLEMAKKQYEQNLSRYQKGAISRLDVLSSQVAYETKKPTLESAIVSRDNNLASFKQTIGLPQETEIKLDGTLDEVLKVKSINIENIIEDSTTVKLLEKQLETAKAKVLGTKLTAWGPTISAGWTYQPTVSNLSQNKANDSGALSLSVTLPLDSFLPWSKSADTISTASDSVKDLELQIQNAKTTVKVNTESFLRQINQSLSTIKSLEANINLADETYKMTLQAYNSGAKDLLTLQNAENSLQSAKVNLKSETYNLISTILKLENTLGVPFGTLLK